MTDGYDRAALLAELVVQMGIEPLRADEVTATMVAEATGLNRKTCSEHLNLQVAAGKLTVRNARAENGSKVRAYRRVAADG